MSDHLGYDDLRADTGRLVAKLMAASSDDKESSNAPFSSCAVRRDLWLGRRGH
jgi:hypothetical protein